MRFPPAFALALAALTVAMLAPIVGLAGRVSPAAVAAAFADPQNRAALFVSLEASLAAVAIASLLGVPAGYVLGGARGLWRNAILFALAVPLALPPLASGILLLGVVGERAPLGAWLAAHGLGPVDSLGGVALAEFFVSGSLVAIVSSAAFGELDPAFEESARTLGASRLRSFFTVALPLAAPGVGAGMLLAWLRALGEYGATSIVAYHPTSLSIALEVALSADGLERALALSAGFVALSAAIVALTWLARRRLV
ncbi:MAG: ABC transporter permease subunit [Candidatus Baltobacteraceae bacterium]